MPPPRFFLQWGSGYATGPLLSTSHQGTAGSGCGAATVGTAASLGRVGEARDPRQLRDEQPPPADLLAEREDHTLEKADRREHGQDHGNRLREAPGALDQPSGI